MTSFLTHKVEKNNLLHFIYSQIFTFESPSVFQKVELILFCLVYIALKNIQNFSPCLTVS